MRLSNRPRANPLLGSSQTALRPQLYKAYTRGLPSHWHTTMCQAFHLQSNQCLASGLQQHRLLARCNRCHSEKIPRSLETLPRYTGYRHAKLLSWLHASADTSNLLQHIPTCQQHRIQNMQCPVCQQPSLQPSRLQSWANKSPIQQHQTESMFQQRRQANMMYLPHFELPMPQR